MKLKIENPVRTGFFYIILITLFTGCFSSEPKIQEQVVLQIEGHSFSLQTFSRDLIRKMRYQPVLVAKNPTVVNQIKDSILKDYIVQALTYRWAEKNGVTISNERIDQEIQQIRSSYPDDLTFRKALATENISLNEWRQQLANELLKRAVFEKIAATAKNPSEEEIRQYYKENLSEFSTTERIYLRQIITSTENIAHQIRKDLNRNNFSDMAKKFSVAPEAELGGLLGWVQKGTLDVFDKAFELPTGRVSEVINSPYGHHLFLVESRSGAGHLTYDEVRDNIYKKLLSTREQEVFSHWLETQMQGTKVMQDNALIRATKVEFLE